MLYLFWANRKVRFLPDSSETAVGKDGTKDFLDLFHVESLCHCSKILPV